MLNWLKEILGESYTEDIDKSVSSKIGELFVSKEDFNKKVSDVKTKDETIKELNGQIKDRDKQLDDLKKSSGDNDDLKKQIEQLQADNKTTKDNYEAKIAEMKLNSVVESVLRDSGAKDSISVKAHLAEFLKEAKVGDDGKVTGLSEKIEELKTADTTSFLFSDDSSSEGGLSGAKAAETGTGNGGGNPPGKKIEEMTYEDFVKQETQGQ